jgi:dihydrofolate reductase
MRKLIVLFFITLNGILQAPGGPEEDTSGGSFKYGGWTVPYFDETLGMVMGEQMSQLFELLLGRKTYEIFTSYWPHQDEPALNNAIKYVIIHSPIKLEWKNSVLMKGDAVEETKKLKAQDGPVLLVHGSSLLPNDWVFPQSTQSHYHYIA